MVAPVAPATPAGAPGGITGRAGPSVGGTSSACGLCFFGGGSPGAGPSGLAEPSSLAPASSISSDITFLRVAQTDGALSRRRGTVRGGRGDVDEEAPMSTARVMRAMLATMMMMNVMMVMARVTMMVKTVVASGGSSPSQSASSPSSSSMEIEQVKVDHRVWRPTALYCSTDD